MNFKVITNTIVGVQLALIAPAIAAKTPATPTKAAACASLIAQQGSFEELLYKAEDTKYEAEFLLEDHPELKTQAHQSARDLFAKLPAALETSLKCQAWTTSSLVEKGLEFYSKTTNEYQKETYGQPVYLQMTKRLFAAAPDRFAAEAVNKTYYMLEQDVMNYNYVQSNALKGSLEEGVYKSLKIRAAEMTKARFEQWVFKKPSFFVQEMAKDYQQKQKASAVGSFQYNFYGAMKAIALSR